MLKELMALRIFLKKIPTNFLVLLLLSIIVLGIYFNSLSNGFVSDDIGLIKEGGNLINTGYILAEPTIILRRLLYGLIYQLGGLNPVIFRLSNLLFHIANSFIIYLIVKKLLNFRTALIAASIFAAHPLFSEVVVWISAGNYAQYSFFFLLAFYLYSTAHNKKVYILAFFLFLLALLSFGRAFVLVAIFPLYDYLFPMKDKVFKVKWLKAAPFVLLGLIWFFLLFSQLGNRIQTIESFGFIDKYTYHPASHLPFVISTYLKLLFWPQELSFYHSNQISPIAIILLRWFIVLLLVMGIVFSFIKNKTIFFWLAFFVISSSLYLLPLPIALVAAERYIYLGSVGLIITLAILCQKIFVKIKIRPWSYVILLTILLCLCIRTITRNLDWKNEETLTLATLQTDPSNPTLHNLAGVIYQTHGEDKLATLEFQKAIILDPLLIKPYYNLGLTYQAKGQNDEAIFFFIKAVQLDQNFLLGYQKSAEIYLKKGEFSLAQTNIEKALKLNPNLPELYMLQGQIFLGLNNKVSATTSFKKALELNPQLKEAQIQLKSLETNGS